MRNLTFIAVLKVSSIFILLISFFFSISSCHEDERKTPPDETIAITNFAPISGDPGTNVIVNCRTSLDKVIDRVLFNGLPADIIEATQTRVSVNVPAGATTGKITIYAGDVSADSDTDFTVTSTLDVTSMEPLHGTIGTQVTIHGRNFGTTAGQNMVAFNINRTASIISASATELVVTVPAESVTGSVSVTVNGVTKSSTESFVVIPGPEINGILPSVGAIGSPVIITGRNFSTAPTENVVKFNGIETPVTASTGFQINTRVPVGATTGRIEVIVNGVSIMSASDFQIVEKPVITSFTPDRGSPGTLVTITGANFNSLAGFTVASINLTEATITSATPTELIIIIPSGAETGKIQVLTTVTNGGVLSCISATDFTVPAPIITAFPTAASAGEIITIQGNYFSSISASENIVKIGALDAEVKNATNSSLVIQVPANATTGKISVKVGNQITESATNLTIN